MLTNDQLVRLARGEQPECFSANRETLAELARRVLFAEEVVAVRRRGDTPLESLEALADARQVADKAEKEAGAYRAALRGILRAFPEVAEALAVALSTVETERRARG